MAVYTKVSQEAAAAFLKGYGIGELRELVGIEEGIENSNYYLYTSEGRYILTLYEKRAAEIDLPFFLGLMEHLNKKAVPCPYPVRDKTGSMLGRLAERPAAIISYIDGAPTHQITPDMCLQLGRTLALTHSAGAGFQQQRPNDLSLLGWRKLLIATKDRASEIVPGLKDILEEEISHLSALWPASLPTGVIHADLFPDNVLFDDGKLCGMIDFYFACNDFLAYDIAVCLNAWCFEKDAGFNMSKAETLMKGYNEIRTLTPQEIEAMPLLTRGAALRFLLTRLYDWFHRVPGALVTPKDPLEYLTKLQFHQMVNDSAAYGLKG